MYETLEVERFSSNFLDREVGLEVSVHSVGLKKSLSKSKADDKANIAVDNFASAHNSFPTRI